MKRTRRCPKCKCRKIGYISTVMDDTAGGQRPRRLAETREGGFLKFGGAVHAAEVEAYVCTECGYFEEYVKKPRDVPWDRLEAFERLQPW
jgi:predicted nucleic-acid-binding Zn-ribbon protein